MSSFKRTFTEKVFPSRIKVNRSNIVEKPADLNQRASKENLIKELGGYDGPEPTRFGDWEHKGRCTDF